MNILTSRPSTRRKIGMGDSTPVADFFRAIYLQADQEQRVELVNNYLQLLWRAGLAAGLASTNPVMVKLDATMGQWWTWRTQYNDAVLRRWVPFTRAWGTELDAWADRVQAEQDELDAATSDQVKARLAQQGLDPSALAPDAGADLASIMLRRMRDLLKSAWFWPVVGTVGVLVIAGAALKLYKGVKHEITE